MSNARTQIPFILVAFLALSPPAAQGQTQVPGGLIDTDTVWAEAGSPFVLQGQVLLAPGTTLSVEPAVEIQLNGYDLLISGTLTAIGLPTRPIRSVGPGSLRFTDYASPASYMNHCVVDNHALQTTGYLPTIDACRFEGPNSALEMYTVPRTDVVIRDSVFVGNTNLIIKNASTLVFENNIVDRPVYIHAPGSLRILSNDFSAASDAPCLQLDVGGSDGSAGIIGDNSGSSAEFVG